jgi:hypothetical protein
LTSSLTTQPAMNPSLGYASTRYSAHPFVPLNAETADQVGALLTRARMFREATRRAVSPAKARLMRYHVDCGHQVSTDPLSIVRVNEFAATVAEVTARHSPI